MISIQRSGKNKMVEFKDHKFFIRYFHSDKFIVNFDKSAFIESFIIIASGNYDANYSIWKISYFNII